MTASELSKLDPLAQSVVELYEDTDELLTEEVDGFEVWGNNDSEETLTGNVFIRFKNSLVDAVKANYKKKTIPVLIGIVYLISTIKILKNMIELVNGAFLLDYSISNTNIAYFLFWISFPFVIWIISTAYEQYNYHIIKIAGLVLCIINLAMIIAQVTYLATYMFIIPFILQIPLSRDVSSGMVVNLARGIVLIIPVTIGIISFLKISKPLYVQPEMVEDILHFKVNRNLDLRPDKKYAYDYKATRSMKTGKVFRVQEPIRKQHSMFVGATGTGKTSMGFNPGIADDLDQRLFNENAQKKEIEKLLNSKDIVLNANINDSQFDLKYFRPITNKGKKSLDKIKKRMPLCGITIIAPNSSFGDDVYDMAIKRGFTKINRIDPSDGPDGKHKPGYKGFNPLYLNQSLDVESQRQEIISKSRIFSDVLQALFEEGGSKDVYFSGLNRQFTSSICTMQMKAKPLLHKKNPQKYPTPQVTPWDFYEVVNDFPMAQDYYDALNDYLKEHPEEKDNYINILKLIGRDILGPGAKTMVEQARGLVNQVADLLANPRIRNILCNSDTVDLDEALANNEITLLNYELSMGDSDSRALGLFFLLSYQSAVFRRPKHNRPLHLVYIDEYPVLLHPKMSKCFTIFRQYNVCMNVALQSLSQFDEKTETAFMKSVMLSNASTQVIFGRAGLEEMQTYMALGGKKNVVTEQSTISESSISQEDTSLSYSTRRSVQQVDAVNPSSIRNSDFKEAQMITVDKGNPVSMFAVKLNFLSYKQECGLKRYKVNWSKYYEPSIADGTIEVPETLITEKSVSEEQEQYNILVDRRFKQSAIVKDRFSKDNSDNNTDIPNKPFKKTADILMRYENRMGPVINSSSINKSADVSQSISSNISIKLHLNNENYYEEPDEHNKAQQLIKEVDNNTQEEQHMNTSINQSSPQINTNTSMDSLLGIDFMNK